MACGNNNVSRSYLSSQPQPATAPLTGIRVTLPEKRRTKADVYVSTMGTFVDRADPNRTGRRIADVRTPSKDPKTGKHEQKWDHKLDTDHRDSKLGKPYWHLTGRTGNFGPESFMQSLPKRTQKEFEKARKVVLIRKPYWTDERGEVRPTIARRPK